MSNPVFTVYVQPGESISQALIRSMLMRANDGEREVILIPPGVSISGPKLKQAKILKHRATRIPFLD